MPNINIGYIRYMEEKIRNLKVDACVTRLGDRLEHFNAFYSRNVIDDIEELLSKDCRSVSSLTRRVNTFYVEEKEARRYSPGWDMFMNVNTREDLDRYIDSLIKFT
jgi:molybdopterin-guanine dinucleotide biosynthesis protein A